MSWSSSSNVNNLSPRNILFITLFSSLGGTSRIYVYQFIPHLLARGFSSTVRNIYPDRFFRIQMGLTPTRGVLKTLNFFWYSGIGVLKFLVFAWEARQYDAVYVQKYTAPKFAYWFLRKMNPRVIYGFEDAIYEINPFLNKKGLWPLLFKYEAYLFRNMVRRAKRVMAENDYLAAEAKKMNQNVFIISAPIDIKKFIPKEHPPRERITLGWIGSPSTTYLLETLKPVLAAIGAKYKNVRLKTVGARLDFSIADMSCERKRWREEEELEDLHSFDIGLMPLDDAPFNRGRLGYKMIQYMSVGIPIVASSIGLNKVAVKEGINGFLAATPEEWQDHLSRLISDETLRKTMGARGRRIVETEYALEKKADILAHVFRDVVKTGTDNG